MILPIKHKVPPTQADARRLSKHVLALTEIARMPNAEHVADAHNEAVRFLRAFIKQMNEKEIMRQETDVIERAQAWLAEADKKGISRTDKYGYLAVIEDLVAEVEFQRTALQGYRSRQIELTDLLSDIRSQGRITGDIAKRLIAALDGDGK